MRYGLDRLLNLVSGVTLATSKTLPGSQRLLLSRHFSHGASWVHCRALERMNKLVVVRPVGTNHPSSAIAFSSLSIHHDRPEIELTWWSQTSTSRCASFRSLPWQRPRSISLWPNSSAFAHLSHSPTLWRSSNSSISASSFSHVPPPSLNGSPIRHFSTSLRTLGDDKDSDEKKEVEAETNPKSKGIVQRFKEAYYNYGKVLLVFHWASYAVYFTTFLGMSYAGLDVVVVLEAVRNYLPYFQSWIDAIIQSGAGHVAVAFILCKLITPIRYLTTIVGTKYIAEYLRRHGYIAPIPQGDRIGELAKESQKIIERKSAALKTKMARSGRRLRKVNEVRIRKTNKAVTDWRSRIRLGKRKR